MSDTTFKFPTEKITLPSQGKLYQSTSPLYKGYIELKYLSANEEEILVNPNYLANDTVVEKLFEAMSVDKSIKFGDLLTGDMNAVLFACRILAYGEEYKFKYTNPITQELDIATANLNQIENKPLYDEAFALNTDGTRDYKNEFEFMLPRAKIPVTFKLLNRSDREAIKTEEKSWKKLFPEKAYGRSLFLIYSLLSIDGKYDQKVIREFIDKGIMTSLDSSKLREYMYKVSPDLNTVINITFENGAKMEVDIPITGTFLYPETL